MNAYGPIAASYWVDERLAAGVHPLAFGPGGLQELLADGFDAFVDLTERPPYHAGGAEVVRAPVPDMGLPDDVDGIVDEIDRLLADGRRVYVHCWAGRGRTGTVIGSWLARHGSTTPLEDLAALRTHLDTPSPETDEQRRFVRDRA